MGETSEMYDAPHWTCQTIQALAQPYDRLTLANIKRADTRFSCRESQDGDRGVVAARILGHRMVNHGSHAGQPWAMLMIVRSKRILENKAMKEPL